MADMMNNEVIGTMEHGDLSNQTPVVPDVGTAVQTPSSNGLTVGQIAGIALGGSAIIAISAAATCKVVRTIYKGRRGQKPKESWFTRHNFFVKKESSGNSETEEKK